MSLNFISRRKLVSGLRTCIIKLDDRVNEGTIVYKWKGNEFLITEQTLLELKAIYNKLLNGQDMNNEDVEYSMRMIEVRNSQSKL